MFYERFLWGDVYLALTALEAETLALTYCPPWRGICMKFQRCLSTWSFVKICCLWRYCLELEVYCVETHSLLCTFFFLKQIKQFQILLVRSLRKIFKNFLLSKPQICGENILAFWGAWDGERAPISSILSSWRLCLDQTTGLCTGPLSLYHTPQSQGLHVHCLAPALHPPLWIRYLSLSLPLQVPCCLSQRFLSFFLVSLCKGLYAHIRFGISVH